MDVNLLIIVVIKYLDFFIPRGFFRFVISIVAAIGTSRAAPVTLHVINFTFKHLYDFVLMILVL